jgi:ABC-2 type transport system permease protein
MPFFVLMILLLGPVVAAVGAGVASGHVHWSLHSGTTQVIVIMFVPAMFFYFQAVKLFWRLLAEIQAGTIEQVYLSPLPSWLAAAGRLAAAPIETCS